MNVTKFQKGNISFWKLSISKAQGKPKTSKEQAKHTEFPKPQLETEKTRPTFTILSMTLEILLVNNSLLFCRNFFLKYR